MNECLNILIDAYVYLFSLLLCKIIFIYSFVIYLLILKIFCFSAGMIALAVLGLFGLMSFAHADDTVTVTKQVFFDVTIGGKEVVFDVLK